MHTSASSRTTTENEVSYCITTIAKSHSALISYLSAASSRLPTKASPSAVSVSLRLEDNSDPSRPGPVLLLSFSRLNAIVIETLT